MSVLSQAQAAAKTAKAMIPPIIAFAVFCGGLSLRQNRHPYISLQRAEAKGKRRPQKEAEIEYR